MLIKFDADLQQVDLLKAFSGEKVGSKAFFYAALQAPDLMAEVRNLRRQLEHSREENRVLRQTLDRGRSAAVQFLEVCAQEDLLNG